MAKSDNNFYEPLEGFIRGLGYKITAVKDSNNNDVLDPKHADQIEFLYKKNSFEGPVTVTSRKGIINLIYSKGVLKNKENGVNKDWANFVEKFKNFSLRNGRGEVKVMNLNNLNYELRKIKQEQIEKNLLESYYGNKNTSYSDYTPGYKIVIKHKSPLGENSKRYTNIEKIFVETDSGERLLLKTRKPSIARAYARHLSEGGEYNDERWKHITEISEDLSKLSGFVRATRSEQFNESVVQVVNEAINHYQQLRETIRKIQSSRGYNNYFENWKPSLMEEIIDSDYTKLFSQSRLDPRIEQAIPVLKKLNISVTEMPEATQFENWTNSILEGLTASDTKKAKDLVDLLSGAEKDAIGPSGMNIIGKLKNILPDAIETEDLYDELEEIASIDPNFDAEDTITSWLKKNANLDFNKEVLSRLEKVGGSTTPPAPAAPAPAAPVKKAEPANPEKSVPNEIPEPSPEDKKALQQFMPQPLAEKAKKPAQRNFVAKHAQRSGAGAHGKRGYQRNPKHKSKLGEEGVEEGSTSKEKQKTPYRNINSPEYKAVIDEDSMDQISRIKKLSGLK
jgi:hypothetical protein